MTPEKQAAATPVSNNASVRVLVVDDDVDAAVGVKELLELQGHTVAVEHNGTGALQAAVMMKPDVALVDLRLKGEWGLDVVQSLRGQFPDIVSVIMTGESDSNTVIKALRQGVYDYLTKPFQPDQMISVIERAAEKVRLHEDRQLMMNELASAKDRAELASSSKTEFLTRLSGELGEQFTTLVKLSEIMTQQQLGPIGDQDYVKCAGGIADGCRRLSRVMLWIGELGQLEAGSMPVNRSQFELQETIQKVLAIFEQMISAKQLKTHLNLAPNLPLVNSDSEHFSRIFGHLISNAVKFSQPGGTIEITAMVDGFGELRIDISDEGVGIPAEKLQLALAPFGRLGNSPEPDPFGVGLGLPLAEKLSALLGGKLSVENTQSGGTRVQLRFSGDQLCHDAVQASGA